MGVGAVAGCANATKFSVSYSGVPGSHLSLAYVKPAIKSWPIDVAYAWHMRWMTYIYIYIYIYIYTLGFPLNAWPFIWTTVIVYPLAYD